MVSDVLDRCSGSHMKLFKRRVKIRHMIFWLTPTSSYCSAFRLWLKSWRLRRFLSCFARWSSCFCQIETGSSSLPLCSAVKHGMENSACIQCKEAREDTNGELNDSSNPIHTYPLIQLCVYSDKIPEGSTMGQQQFLQKKKMFTFFFCKWTPH